MLQVPSFVQMRLSDLGQNGSHFPDGNLKNSYEGIHRFQGQFVFFCEEMKFNPIDAIKR